jgi:hypothetical protein
MEGFDLISVADDEKLGTVVRKEGDYIVFEHGMFKKQQHAVPSTAVEIDEGAREVRTTLSKRLIEDSPRVDDSIDRDALARHYGAPDTAEDAVQERVQIREGGTGDRAGGIPQESPAMLGERYSSADVPEDER